MSPTLLRAFRHPLVIGSIFVLLVNDHILKVYTPSWLTGKISDFAGLFFFPLLLGALLERFPRLRKAALPTAFALTGLAFAGLKTLPSFNGAISGLLGVKIVRDPSDLLALVMFLPAWKLAQGLDTPTPSLRPERLEYAMILLGSLAALATSPAPPVLSVQRLVVFDNLLYTASKGPSGYSSATDIIAVASRDAGQSWMEMRELPPEVRNALRETASLPVTACLPNNASTCYRVDGRPLVEESRDGGNTWVVSWQIPPGRAEYMTREPFLPMFYSDRPDLNTYDLTIAPLDGQWTPVAAMGTEGVVSLVQGKWLRLPVSQTGYQDARPKPFAASGLGDGFIKVSLEILLALAAGLLFYMGISIYGWVLAGRHLGEGVPSPRPIYKTLRFLGGWLLVSIALYIFSGLIHNPLNTILLVPAAAGLVSFPLVWVIVIAVKWGAMQKAAGQLEVRSAAVVAFATAFCLFLVPTLAFLLWTWAVIPFYSLALSIAAAAGFACLAAGIIFIRRRLRG